MSKKVSQLPWPCRATLERKNTMTGLASERRMAALLEKLQQDPSLAESLPSVEGEMVRAALNGSTIYEIAQVHEVTEAAVWEILGRVARAATGQVVDPVVTGGLGSDERAGHTGIGDIGTEPRNRSEPSSRGTAAAAE